MKKKLAHTDSIIGNFAGKPTRIIIIILSMLFIIFPLYWLLISSFKVKADYLAYPPIIFPTRWSTESYVEVLNKDKLLSNFINTFVVAAVSTFLSVLFGAMTAYAVARGNIGKRYRRQDEIGTPYCITYDFDSEEDKAVTVRERDSMKQVRLPISELKAYFEDKFDF